MNSLTKKAVYTKAQITEFITEIENSFNETDRKIINQLLEPAFILKAIQPSKVKHYKKSRKNNFYYYNYGRFKKSGDQYRPKTKPTKVTKSYERREAEEEYLEVELSYIRKYLDLTEAANAIFEKQNIKKIRGIKNIDDEGFIYVFSNSEKTITKIGRTKKFPHRRLTDYVKTHQLEGDWSMDYFFPTQFVSRVEFAAHSIFENKRLNLSTGARELFNMDPASAKTCIENILTEFNDKNFVASAISFSNELHDALAERRLVREKIIKKIKKQITNYVEAKTNEERSYRERLEKYERLPMLKRVISRKPKLNRQNIHATEASELSNIFSTLAFIAFFSSFSIAPIIYFVFGLDVLLLISIATIIFIVIKNLHRHQTKKDNSIDQ